jgi:pimeloyl-ACP methyl ester carboxylesterase
MKHTTRFFLLFLIINTANQAIPQPITYAYQTEVNVNNEEDFELPPQLEALAQTCYSHLNSSLFFNTKFIQHPQEVRQWHKERLNGQCFTVTTRDGFQISGTFFDRHSDHVIIIGPGFTNNRELMAPFVAMFEDADIVLFDFRGHGYGEKPISFFSSSLSMYFFEADAHKTTIGKKEELDVLAIISHIKKIKNNPNYKIYGLGICFGAFVFLKTAALYPNTFDKLVLDGCWLSLRLFIEKIKKDPRLICVPQEGGWEKNWFFRRKLTQKALEPLARYLFGFDLAEVSLVDILEKNKTNLQQLDVLFFQGKNDLVVLRNEFEQFWNALPTQKKTAIITSNPHVKNHWKQKELYALLCRLFFELPQPNFIAALKSPTIVCKQIINALQNKLAAALLAPGESDRQN